MINFVLMQKNIMPSYQLWLSCFYRKGQNNFVNRFGNQYKILYICSQKSNNQLLNILNQI